MGETLVSQWIGNTAEVRQGGVHGALPASNAGVPGSSPADPTKIFDL